jgi:hypothetical protein
MNHSRLVLGLCIAIGAMGLSACNNAERIEAERQARHARAAEAKAAERLASFKQLQAGGREDLALNLAEDIVTSFPGTAAAKEVQPILDGLRASVAAGAEEQRLKGLWVYHSGEDAEAGGVVRSAYLYSSNTLGEAESGKDAPKARLVLRRHPQWGDDVYLLTDRGHFSCADPCTVSVQFDDAPAVTYPGKLPETGEPAMFVEDFKAIVEALPGAAIVRFDVTLDDGSQHRPAFEVGGYEETTIGNPNRPAGN